MCRIWNLVHGKLALIELFNKIYISLDTILVLLSHVCYEQHNLYKGFWYNSMQNVQFVKSHPNQSQLCFS